MPYFSSLGAKEIGFPQLGPLSFLLYLNDLPERLQFTKPHTYADDTILSAAVESTIEVQSRINQDLFNVGNWLVANKLSINVAKTGHMFFSAHMLDCPISEKQSQFS